jgi:hypothetical protein
MRDKTHGVVYNSFRRTRRYLASVGGLGVCCRSIDVCDRNGDGDRPYNGDVAAVREREITRIS